MSETNYTQEEAFLILGSHFDNSEGEIVNTSFFSEFDTETMERHETEDEILAEFKM